MSMVIHSSSMSKWAWSFIRHQCQNEHDHSLVINHQCQNEHDHSLVINVTSGPFKCYVTQMGVGVSHFLEKKLYEGVRFNVISITRGGRGSNFQKKALHNTWMTPLPSYLINRNRAFHWIYNETLINLTSQLQNLDPDLERVFVSWFVFRDRDGNDSWRESSHSWNISLRGLFYIVSRFFLRNYLVQNSTKKSTSVTNCTCECDMTLILGVTWFEGSTSHDFLLWFFSQIFLIRWYDSQQLALILKFTIRRL